MKMDPRPLESLLKQETDDPIPPDHEAMIRQRLAAHLGARKGSGRDPRSPSGNKPSAQPSAQSGSVSAIRRAIGIALIAGGAASLGFVAGRVTAPEKAATPAPPLAQDDVSKPLMSEPPVVPSAAPLPLASNDGPSLPVAPRVMESATARTTPSAAPTSASSASASALAGATAFDREQSLLERARSAVARHDAVAAQTALDASRREFPFSKFSEERDYLEVLILFEAGDKTQGRQKANAFVAKYPTSLLRSRIESLTHP